MFRRRAPPPDPVTVYLDGSPVVAARGEPLAVALLGAGVRALARSPKLHRPRAPSCLRGACDGCLARVDGVPNVTTCLVPALGGERVEAQNVVGSREADLLRITDWFFPRGIDHHHLMTGVPGVQDLVTGFARKLAGLGKLPTSPRDVKPARRAEIDVLVIGAGLAGLSAAATCAARGLAVTCVDDGLVPGGAALGVPDVLADVRRSLGHVEVASRTTAVGVYPAVDPDGTPAREILLADPTGATVLRARAVILAAGAHDGALAVPNADLPGVVSARAACALLAAGVEPDGPTAVVGAGYWADALLARLGPDRACRVDADAVVEIRGRGRPKSLVVGRGKETTKLDAAIVALATPCAPAFELAAQLGAELDVHPPAGWVPRRDETGRIAEATWATGECAGLPFDPDLLVRDGRRVAERAIEALAS